MSERFPTWKIWVPMLGLSLALSAAIIVGFGVGIQNRRLLETIESNRAQRIAQINYVNWLQCRKTQELFTARREEAEANFKNLDRDGRLLGITITPELRRVAASARAATLERFKASPCPRRVVSEEEVIP